MKMRMRATDSLTYATRRLLPGDEFEAPPKDARILMAIRKAKQIRAPANINPPSPAVAERITAAVGELAALRTDYERALGKKPFNGWGVETLREKITAVKAG